MTKLPALALAASFLTTPTLALSEEDWTGFYAGIHVGTSEFTSGGVRDSDPSMGLHAGYDYDLGNFVVGGELAYDAGAEYTLGGTTQSTKTARIKLKGGYDLGRILVYGVVGVARFEGDSARRDGFTLGLGANYKVTDRITIGAEYLHDSLDDVGAVGADMDTVTLRASYRF